MSDLTLDDIRIDYVHEIHPHVIFIDAAAEMTRYNCLFVLDPHRGGWFIMCENLQHALPALPHLSGWHWNYIAGKIQGNNARTGMALALLAQYVHDNFVARQS